eukprot:2105777-Amphidinium_carterae.1
MNNLIMKARFQCRTLVLFICYLYLFVLFLTQRTAAQIEKAPRLTPKDIKSISPGWDPDQKSELILPTGGQYYSPLQGLSIITTAADMR